MAANAKHSFLEAQVFEELSSNMHTAHKIGRKFQLTRKLSWGRNSFFHKLHFRIEEKTLTKIQVKLSRNVLKSSNKILVPINLTSQIFELHLCAFVLHSKRCILISFRVFIDIRLTRRRTKRGQSHYFLKCTSLYFPLLFMKPTSVSREQVMIVQLFLLYRTYWSTFSFIGYNQHKLKVYERKGKSSKGTKKYMGKKIMGLTIGYKIVTFTLSLQQNLKNFTLFFSWSFMQPNIGPISSFKLKITYIFDVAFANATLSGRMNDAHNIHFPGATRRTLRISTSNATSDSAILIRCINQERNHM